MKNISRCVMHDNTDSKKQLSLSPSNIHILALATPDYADSFHFQLESIRLYSRLHGYHFRVVDPDEVMFFYSINYTESNWAVDWKPFIYYCKLILIRFISVSITVWNQIILGKRFTNIVAMRSGLCFWILML